MGFKCGIVGLPNVGKSTLFNAMTNSAIAAENYPFCTIEPNVGVVPAPDPRLKKLADIVSPARVVPATVEFVDVAGLVSGAAQGEGLGNRFLAQIRETQAIAEVVRCFDDDNIVHVAGRVDPIADVEVIETELGLADLESLERALAKLAKTAKSGDQDALRKRASFERVLQHLDAGKAARTLSLDEREREDLSPLFLLTRKPLLYIANVDERGAVNNPWLEKLRALAERQGAWVVPICATLEAEIAELDEASKREFLREMGLEEPGLNHFIRAGYALLNLHTYFTAGPKEARAWSLPQGASALRAAAAIHTDFATGFIRAEVIGYDDFVAHGGEQGAKQAGKWRLEGRDYIVNDGDVIHFRFNV